MNKPAKQVSRDEADNAHKLPASSEVGYGKPPAEHRFRKGQSGNPKGRPKGSRNTVPKGQGLDVAVQPANRMLLEEAYRTVSIREGEKVIELPVIKAVFRSLGVSAMKGNRLAQAAMAELVRGIEEEERQTRSNLFEAACEYKINWEQAISHARKHNLPEPAPVPHPDDVILDMRRGEVCYAGPMTAEDKKHWDRMLEFRDELQGEVSLLAGGYRRVKKSKANAGLLNTLAANWKQNVEMYDRINEPLPERYYKRLEDRFYPGILECSGGEQEK